MATLNPIASALRLAIAVAWWPAALPCVAAAPTIYSRPTHQSPVRGDADDLLLLPGYGFAAGDTVVYRAISDSALPLERPASVPTHSTDISGVADIVSVVDAPYSLTVRLPGEISAEKSYALWVIDSTGEWSNGVKINDARPLWISPNEVYTNANPASLPRILKVVGRNLNPPQGKLTHVRLVGPTTYQLPAALHAKDHAAMDRYVAEIALPRSMPVGTYDVQVSRDGVSWASLDDGQKTRETLSVMPEPSKAAEFRVGDYSFGTCTRIDDSCPAARAVCRADASEQNDQTQCVVAAIAAARAAGGGTVVFGPGIWNMNNPGAWKPDRSISSKGVTADGILVPEGVSLWGSGSSATHVVRGPNWDMHLASFALQGRNSVSGFDFRDARVYKNDDPGASLLTLGTRWDRARHYHPGDPTSVSHVAITRNIFDRPFVAVGSGGLPIDHLYVANNVFGAFTTALSLEGNPANLMYRYRFSDSAVVNNQFFPGSYLNPAIRQGSIATGLSGGYRIDFSGNTADGTSTAYLYNPQTDAKGWRAAYFWALHDNAEMILVSQNVALCTGDKDGDGEAIAFDNNHDRPGFAALAVPVVSATSDAAAASSTITLQASMIETQMSYGVPIDVRPVNQYYLGDWLQVVQGPGLGQARKISSISTASTPAGQSVTLTVTPRFDVLPQKDSLVTDGRLYWQVYTIDNVVDQRKPLCLKSNRTRQAGGMIELYASTVDSVVEGNRQYDTSGIVAAHGFALAGAEVQFPGATMQSFNEIRDNLISGRYDDNDRTPQALSGILLQYGATEDTRPPPVLSYGLAVSHNLITRAGTSKGAISLNRGWYTGPKSAAFAGVTPWKIADATLIFKNTLVEIGPGTTGAGIGLSADDAAAPIEWRSTLYGNVCSDTMASNRKLLDRGTGTVRYCPAARADSCECQAPRTDLGITGNSDAVRVPVGGEVTYTLVITNGGPAPATAITVAAEPADGLTIVAMNAADAICDVADANVNLCRIGNLDSHARRAVRVVARVNAAGAEQAFFSVTHAEADSNVVNDGIAITTFGTEEAGPPSSKP